MTLGQPDTPAEREAEQRQLAARSAARERRNAQIVREIRDDLSCGNPLDKSCLSAARRHKLGKGGATYVRELVDASTHHVYSEGSR